MHQTLTIPQHRDPVARAALIGCAFALAWLVVTSALPQASAQEQPAERVVIIVATPTLPASLPEAVPMVSVATAAPAPPVAAAPASDVPQSAVTNADPLLQIERDAAEAYRQLPTAAAPSEENQQPNYSKRPHTGR